MNDALQVAIELVLAQYDGELILLICEFEHDATEYLSVGANVLHYAIASIDWNLQSKIFEVPPVLRQLFFFERKYNLALCFGARRAPVSVLRKQH